MRLPASVIRPIARAGYASRGIVYLIVGVFAFIAGVSAGGDQKGAKGALQTLLEQPFGQALIWCMIVGLAGYAVWRFVQSIFDTDDHGLDAKGVVVRGGLLTSGITYAYLALFALGMLGVLGGGSDGKSSGPVAMAESMLGSTVTLIAMATIFLGVAIAHWVKAFKRKYEDHIDAPERMMPMVHAVSISGLTARGVAFAILSAIAVFRLVNPSDGAGEKPGIKEALEFVQNMPAGNVLLMIMGAGVVLFAIYSLIEARWRHINVEDA